MKTIDELLGSLQNINKIDLPNTPETWRRIGSSDPFLELGLEEKDLATFLEEWCNNNEYSNL